MHATVNRNLVQVCIQLLVTNILTYILWIHKCVKMNKGCEISHKYTKYMEFLRWKIL